MTWTEWMASGPPSRGLAPVVQALVDRHGAEAVHEAWLEVWGWPATWTPSEREAEAVRSRLATTPTATPTTTAAATT